MVDQIKLTRLLSLLSQYLTDLKVETEISFDNFKKDIKTRRFVERTLQMCIEVCLDAGSHIIADNGWKEAATNVDVFSRLEEHGVVSSNLLKKLLQMASFRNRLVHDYAEIEPEIVFGILQNHLSDFEDYISQLLKLN